MSAILSFVLAHSGLVIAVLAFLFGHLATLVGPAVVDAYGRLCSWLKAKVGINLPDDPAVQAAIDKDAAAVLAALPGLIAKALAGGLSVGDVISAFEAAVAGAAAPKADPAPVPGLSNPNSASKS